MINFKSKIFLFFSSYAPLFLIILIQNHRVLMENGTKILDLFYNNNFCSWNSLFTISKAIINPVTIILLFLIIGIGFLIYLLIKNNLFAQNKFKITQIQNVTSDNMTYIISYLVPFLSLNLNSTANLYSIIVLILTIGVIYVNSDMLYINPLLNWFGYRTYKISGKILNRDKDVNDVFFIIPKEISQISVDNVINQMQYDTFIYIASSISNK